MGESRSARAGSKLRCASIPGQEAFADYADNEYVKKRGRSSAQRPLRRPSPGDIVTDIQRTVDAVWRIEFAHRRDARGG